MTTTTVCQKCGVIGYADSLVFCSKCHISAEHRYCLTTLPREGQLHIDWSCEECKPSFSRAVFSDTLRLHEGQKNGAKYQRSRTKKVARTKGAVSICLRKKFLKDLYLRSTCPSEQNEDPNKLDGAISSHNEISTDNCRSDSPAEYPVNSNSTVAHEIERLSSDSLSTKDEEHNVTKPHRTMIFDDNEQLDEEDKYLNRGQSSGNHERNTLPDHSMVKDFTTDATVLRVGESGSDPFSNRRCLLHSNATVSQAATCSPGDNDVLAESDSGSSYTMSGIRKRHGRRVVFDDEEQTDEDKSVEGGYSSIDQGLEGMCSIHVDETSVEDHSSTDLAVKMNGTPPNVLAVSNALMETEEFSCQTLVSEEENDTHSDHDAIDVGQIVRKRKRLILDDESSDEKNPSAKYENSFGDQIVTVKCSMQGNRLLSELSTVEGMCSQLTALFLGANDDQQSTLLPQSSTAIVDQVSARTPDVLPVSKSCSSKVSMESEELYCPTLVSDEEEKTYSCHSAINEDKIVRRKRRRLILDDVCSDEEEPLAKYGDQITTDTCSVQGNISLQELSMVKHGSSHATALVVEMDASELQVLANDPPNSPMMYQIPNPHVMSSHPSMSNSFNCAPALPIRDPIWRGCFNISNGGDVPLVAHLSSRACERVHVRARMLPQSLCLEKLLRLQSWPKSFKSSPPTENSIALYFFPGSGSGIPAYDRLLSEIIGTDLMLKVTIEDAELLIFSSTELPEPYQRFGGKHYVWGVFRRSQTPIPSASISSSFKHAAEERTASANCSDGRNELTDCFAVLDKELDARAEALRANLENFDRATQQELSSLDEREKSANRSIAKAALNVLERCDAAIVAICLRGPPPGADLATKVRYSCLRMDSDGFWGLIVESKRPEVEALRPQLPQFLAACVDPPRFVMDALSMLFPVDSNSSQGRSYEWACLLMLESLISVLDNSELCKHQPRVATSLRERAKKAAASWKDARKLWLSAREVPPPYAHTFLLHAVAFEIVLDEDKELYRKLVMSLSGKMNMPKLALSLGLGGETMSAMIKELIDAGKKFHAINFISEAGLVEEFPLAQLLKACLSDSKKLAGKKKRNCLRVVIRSVLYYKLETELPLDGVLEQVEQLEKKGEGKLVPSPKIRKDNLQEPIKQLEKKVDTVLKATKPLEEKAGGSQNPVKQLKSDDNLQNSIKLLKKKKGCSLNKPIRKVEYNDDILLRARPIKQSEKDDSLLKPNIQLGKKGDCLPKVSNPQEKKGNSWPKPLKQLEKEAMQKSIKQFLLEKNESCQKPHQLLEKKDNSLRKPIQQLENKDDSLQNTIKQLEKKDDSFPRHIQRVDKKDNDLQKPSIQLEKNSDNLPKAVNPVEKKEECLPRTIKQSEKADSLQKPTPQLAKNDDSLLNPVKLLEREDCLQKTIKQLKKDDSCARPIQQAEKKDGGLQRPNMQFEKGDNLPKTINPLEKEDYLPKPIGPILRSEKKADNLQKPIQKLEKMADSLPNPVKQSVQKAVSMQKPLKQEEKKGDDFPKPVNQFEKMECYSQKPIKQVEKNDSEQQINQSEKFTKQMANNIQKLEVRLCSGDSYQKPVEQLEKKDTPNLEGISCHPNGSREPVDQVEGSKIYPSDRLAVNSHHLRKTATSDKKTDISYASKIPFKQTLNLDTQKLKTDSSLSAGILSKSLEQLEKQGVFKYKAVVEVGSRKQLNKRKNKAKPHKLEEKNNFIKHWEKKKGSELGSKQLWDRPELQDELPHHGGYDNQFGRNAEPRLVPYEPPDNYRRHGGKWAEKTRFWPANAEKNCCYHGSERTWLPAKSRCLRYDAPVRITEECPPNGYPEEYPPTDHEYPDQYYVPANFVYPVHTGDEMGVGYRVSRGLLPVDRVRGRPYR